MARAMERVRPVRGRMRERGGRVGGRVVECGDLPAEQAEGVEAEEEAVGTAFDGVAEAGGEEGHSDGDDGRTVSSKAADEEEEAELEEEEAG